MTPERRKYLVFGVVAAVAILIDQWTKVLARHHLKQLGYAGRKVIDGIFTLRYSENTGVAFGMLQSLKGGRIILTLVALAAFGLVIYYLRRSDADHRRFHVALGLVGGGAIGNLVDRIAFGGVTDFLVFDLGFWPFNPWPAFNVADAALVIGVALMALDMARPQRETSAVAPEAAERARDLASTGRLLPLLVSLLLASSLIAADVASKSWAESELRRRGARTLLGGRLVLRYQTNSGIAFGLLQPSLHPYKRPFLIAYSSAVTAGLAALLLFRLWRRRAQRDCLIPLGLVALLAGAAGNLRDRITRGAVIDFIDLQPSASVSWPAFNLADLYLALGLILCLVGLLAARRAARN